MDGLGLKLLLGSAEETKDGRGDSERRMTQGQRNTHTHKSRQLTGHGCVCVFVCVFARRSNCDFRCDYLSFSFSHTQNVEPTAEIRPYNSCVTLKDTRQSVTSGLCVFVCVLPDVKCAFLCGAERRGAGTDTAGHHLFPQVMDLRLETTVLYTHTQTHKEDKHC